MAMPNHEPASHSDIGSAPDPAFTPDTPEAIAAEITRAALPDLEGSTAGDAATDRKELIDVELPTPPVNPRTRSEYKQPRISTQR